MILRSTKKLLAVLGASRVAEPGPTPDAEDWFDRRWFDRRTCLLLTHAATLFSIFEADVRAVDLRAARRLVTELVERELRREGLPPATFGNLRSQELILAKTADRSVLGCMNDTAPPVCSGEADVRQQVVQHCQRIKSGDVLRRGRGNVSVLRAHCAEASFVAGAAGAPRRKSRAASTDPPANIPTAHQNAVV